MGSAGLFFEIVTVHFLPTPGAALVCTYRCESVRVVGTTTS
jgi:hypothetical protein